MTDKQFRSKFPNIAVLVLIVGLAAVVIVALRTSLPFLSSAEEVEDVEQAKDLVDQYLAVRDNLKVKEIMEFSNHFYVLVQEENTGINAFELLIDPHMGSIGYEPGPNMMWNRKYGHMGRVTDPTGSMPISSQQASDYAQDWLDKNRPGVSVEETEIFYGYYTVDVSEDGEVVGMLSLNGYSGEIWYHSWHGEFIRIKEYN